MTKIRKGGEAPALAAQSDSQEPPPAQSEGGIESPSDELARLIREQERDDRRFQDAEPFTVHFDVVGLDQENIFDVLDLGRVLDRTRGCGIHGKAYWRAQPSGRWYCVECNKEYQNDRRRALGIQPRPRCPHGYKTKTECVDCRRSMLRVSRKKWRLTAKGKAYAKAKDARRIRTPEMRHAEYLRKKEREANA